MYQIYTVPDRAADWPEQLGTKFKFWYSDPQHGLTLFKEGRPGTGENWAEKIACELANCLRMPHAQYEFAKFKKMQGVISRALFDFSTGARLIHGNEVLASIDTTYDQLKQLPYVRSKEHTLRRVLSYLRHTQEIVGAPYGSTRTVYSKTALDFFIGYLMFDCWIANQDRHDQNWGLLRVKDGNSFLAPSFDHGSSMGRNESDEKRKIRLETKDRGLHISHYVTTAKSCFFTHLPNEKPRALSTIDAFLIAARQNPAAANEWRGNLAQVTEQKIQAVIDQVPTELMTDIAKKFTVELLKINRNRILDVSSY